MRKLQGSHWHLVGILGHRGEEKMGSPQRHGHAWCGSWEEVAFSQPEARFLKVTEGTLPAWASRWAGRKCLLRLQARARQEGLGQTVKDTEPDHPAASSFRSLYALCQPLQRNSVYVARFAVHHVADLRRKLVSPHSGVTWHLGAFPAGGYDFSYCPPAGTTAGTSACSPGIHLYMPAGTS